MGHVLFDAAGGHGEEAVAIFHRGEGGVHPVDPAGAPGPGEGRDLAGGEGIGASGEHGAGEEAGGVFTAHGVEQGQHGHIPGHIRAAEIDVGVHAVKIHGCVHAVLLIGERPVLGLGDDEGAQGQRILRQGQGAQCEKGKGDAKGMLHGHISHLASHWLNRSHGSSKRLYSS